jgi:hypothetical protein
MSYFDAYKFPFRRLGAWKNILLLAVCCLIPLVGPLALWGYLRVVFLDVYENPQADCPEFSFDRFGQYIGWGVWPFLAGLLLGVVVLPVMLVGQVGLMVMTASGVKPVVLIAFGVAWFLAYMAAIIVVSVASFPVMLRAMLMQDFGAAYNLRFIKDFLGKMWVEILLKQLFLMVTSFPIMVAGLLCCIVGMYPAVVIVMLAGWYLQIQIYRNYVARGGIEIPIKPLDGPAPVRAFEVGPGPGAV